MDQFDQLNKLGEGSFGQVFKVRRKVDNKIYVLKSIDISNMNSKAKEEASKEASLLAKLDNRYIVKYYDAFISKNKLHIVMEYCEQGDLYGYLRRQNGRPPAEATIWAFFIQMCLGLAYLHSQKICHRDFKTMNVFLAQNQQVRIGDLGVAKVLSDHTNFARTFVGTPYYLSPELCEEKPYNEKSDIWALGCVLYELCTFKHPFDATNQAALIMKIIRGRYDPIVSNYSKNLIDIIEQCLQKNYNQRPSSHQLLQLACVIQYSKTLKIDLKIDQLHPTSNKQQQLYEEEKTNEKKSKSPLPIQSPAVQLQQLQQQKIIEQELQQKKNNNKERIPSQQGKPIVKQEYQNELEKNQIKQQPNNKQKVENRRQSVNKEEEQKQTVQQRRASSNKQAEESPNPIKKNIESPNKKNAKKINPIPKSDATKKQLKTNDLEIEQQVIKSVICQKEVENESDFFGIPEPEQSRENVQAYRILLEKEKVKMELEQKLKRKMAELEQKFGKTKYNELLSFLRSKLSVYYKYDYLFKVGSRLK